MFLDSLEVPGMPETTPFRGFGGPKVVMKAGSLPRRQNCTIEDEEEEGTSKMGENVTRKKRSGPTKIKIFVFDAVSA